jgi:predicted aspartyl protease
MLAFTTCWLSAQPANPIDALHEAQQLMKKHDLKGAYEVVRKASLQGPDLPILLTVLGHIDYLRGEMPAAELEFKKAVKLDDKYGRAWWGLGRVFEAAAFRRQARICYMKAFQVTPEDPEIQRSYARLLKREDQLAQFEKMLASRNKDDDPEDVESLERRIAQLKWVGNRETFVLASPNEHTEVKLSYLLFSPTQMRGFALPVSFNGGKPVRLLMDTGAGGIVLNRKAAQAAGLPKVSDMKFYGIGDEGDRTGYTAFAEKVKIGDVEFTNCPVVVSEKKFLTDEDGLIGTDVFSRFLVSLDFQRMVVKLDPLPKHQASQIETFWEDREVAPEFKEFTSFFRAGHDILLTTRVNDSKPVLFLVDTGASSTLIDPEFAHEFTKVRGEDLVKMKGISGKVDKVQTADAVKLEFGHYRQLYRNVLSIPLMKMNRDSPQMTGILGVPTLVQFRMQIDYRDGLINFEYVGPKW